MFSSLFLKPLGISIDEVSCLKEIESKGRAVWFTAKNNADGSLDFVKDKEDCQFYLGRIKKFPNTLAEVQKVIPDLIVENSYVTKCFPGYTMIPHIDAGRKTAIIIPLGDNKGNISFYLAGKKVHTHTYHGATMTRVDVMHSAENPSDKIRYSITVEIPGAYLRNYLRYR